MNSQQQYDRATGMWCMGDKEVATETPTWVKDYLTKPKPAPMGERIEQLLLFGELDQRKGL